MNLSRKWLSEFVSVDASDKDFAEAMTLSGSKVELTHDLGAEISNVVVGRVLTLSLIHISPGRPSAARAAIPPAGCTPG